MTRTFCWTLLAVLLVGGIFFTANLTVRAEENPDAKAAKHAAESMFERRVAEMIRSGHVANPEMMERLGKEIFTRMDTNEDSKLDMSEFFRGMQKFHAALPPMPGHPAGGVDIPKMAGAFFGSATGSSGHPSPGGPGHAGPGPGGPPAAFMNHAIHKDVPHVKPDTPRKPQPQVKQAKAKSKKSQKKRPACGFVNSAPIQITINFASNNTVTIASNNFNNNLSGNLSGNLSENETALFSENKSELLSGNSAELGLENVAVPK